jgi:F-type H+-transporting ATPase subunit epsilon
MAKQFRLQVFTQEKKVVDDLVTSLQAPGLDGYFGVLADHAPLISALGQGRLTVVGNDGERVYALSGGFLEVANNTATILADSLAEA